jgi:hypothetical protein
MSTIPTSLIPLNGVMQGQQSARQQSQMAGTSNFDALLASFDTGSNQKAKAGSAIDALTSTDASGVGSNDSLASNAASSLNDIFNALLSQDVVPSKFPFSANFAATFGLSGPLPEYITSITAQLNLTATQNLALQNISIENKDAANTPQWIHKIALELQQAGIGQASFL